MGTMTSQITGVSIVYSTGERWIPRTKGQWRGKCSIWWRYHALWPSDAIWWHRSGSTLAWRPQAITWTNLDLSLFKPSGIHLEGNFGRNTPAINYWNKFENYLSAISLKLPRGQWVKNLYSVMRFSFRIYLHTDNINRFKLFGCNICRYIDDDEQSWYQYFVTGRYRVYH